MARGDITNRITEAEIDAISRAGTWGELDACMRSLLTRFGRDDFMLAIRQAGSGERAVEHVMGSAPVALHAPFLILMHAQDDPVCKETATSGLPFEWRCTRLAAQQRHAMYDELERAAYLSGVSVCQRSAGACSRIDLYGKSEAGSQPLSLAERADLLLATTYLHKAAEAILPRTSIGVMPAQLTGRELECLGWSANGKTSAEIGMILGITPRTVYFHLKSVATKLGVYGTRHAISKAVQLGLVIPRASPALPSAAVRQTWQAGLPSLR